MLDHNIQDEEKKEQKQGMKINPLVVGAAVVTAGVVAATLTNKQHAEELKDAKKKIISKGKKLKNSMSKKVQNAVVKEVKKRVT